MTPQPDHKPRYWFPAKRRGYGWGPPATWQGWVVIVVWQVVLLGGSWFVLWPTPRWGWFVGGVAVACVALFVVCRWKGEPTRWRRGDR